ncbi:alkaline shock response membrane anchor protein AmaP [Streptomyces sp. ODS05-4]|uniref:alkaline shock response membrane anchor protein AmaP n=1 Tax=Streptomyces sp. ODS05-4 TaxID=2944939 RepID=UPI00210C536D|nr:alkaline shock response membrane anchor protein AmaP [Streptomyces sp. ODS05-4]
MLRGVNRALLGLAGLVLLCLGGAVLAVVIGLDVPSWWPWHDPDAVLLTDRTRERVPWAAAVAVPAALLVLALIWLFAQVRRPRLAEVLLDTGDGDAAVLRGRALEGAMAAEAEALDGVSRARVRLTGRRTAPAAHLALLLEPYAAPRETLARLDGGAVRHARESAGLAALPAEARLRAVRHPGRRVT